MAPSLVLRAVLASVDSALTRLGGLLGLSGPAPEGQGRMAALDPNGRIGVPLPLLLDLAVEAWRLDRWLGAAGQDQSAAAGRFASRRIGACLAELELETVDLTGQAYEPGLAIELLGRIEDDTLPQGAVVIDEMVSPMCLWQGRVVRHGQAVTRSSPVPATPGGTS